MVTRTTFVVLIFFIFTAILSAFAGTISILKGIEAEQNKPLTNALLFKPTTEPSIDNYEKIESSTPGEKDNAPNVTEPPTQIELHIKDFENKMANMFIDEKIKKSWLSDNPFNITKKCKIHPNKIKAQLKYDLDRKVDCTVCGYKSTSSTNNQLNEYLSRNYNKYVKLLSQYYGQDVNDFLNKFNIDSESYYHQRFLILLFEDVLQHKWVSSLSDAESNSLMRMIGNNNLSQNPMLTFYNQVPFFYESRNNKNMVALEHISYTYGLQLKNSLLTWLNNIETDKVQTPNPDPSEPSFSIATPKNNAITNERLARISHDSIEYVRFVLHIYNKIFSERANIHDHEKLIELNDYIVQSILSDLFTDCNADEYAKERNEVLKDEIVCALKDESCFYQLQAEAVNRPGVTIFEVNDDEEIVPKTIQRMNKH